MKDIDAPAILSLGTSNHDNRPAQLAVARENVLPFIASQTAPVKGGAYFACGFNQEAPNSGRRCADGALPTVFVSLDIDRLPQEQLPAVRSFLETHQCVWWETHSSTSVAPRLRVVLQLDRSVNRVEYRAVCMAIATDLETAVGKLPDFGMDPSVFKPEQPLYCRPPHNPPTVCGGAPLDVEALLKRAPAIAPELGPADRMAAQIAKDPIARRLQERGMLGGEMPHHRGWLHCICPRDDQHTTPKVDPNDDTSTVYRLPRHDGATYGRFFCKHGHCEGRSDEDFIEALDLEPRAVWREQAGRQADQQDQSDGFSDLDAQDGAVVLQNAASITSRPVDWVWPGWLAAGKLALLAGAPGQGKTTIALKIAALITTGGTAPDGTTFTRGAVAMWTGEDDAGDTLNPRLAAAGADLSLVHYVAGAYRQGEITPFDPAKDTPALTAAIRALGNVRLVIVDPIVSAVAGDSHKNTEVRRALQPLVDMAADQKCALLGITHLSKGTQGRDPGERVTGSIAFTAVARVVLMAAKVKSTDGRERRILCRAKSNIGPDEGAFEYRLEQVEALPGINASRVVWGDVIEGSARELLAEAEKDPEPKPKRTRQTDRWNWLRELLIDGPVTVAEIEEQARQVGYSMRSLGDTSRQMCVIKKKSAFGGEGPWTWELPDTTSLFGEPDPAR